MTYAHHQRRSRVPQQKGRPPARVARCLVIAIPLAIAASLGTLLPAGAVAPGASLELSLPWAGDINGTLTGGPHNWNGTADPNHPWNSLDWVPSNSKVYAVRAGTAHTTDCGGSGFVRIDHGGGYQTTYYHLTSVQVSNGQHVDRGQWIGNIGTTVPCGGSASGAHTHFSLWYVSGTFNFSDSQGVDWNGTAIGNWVLDDGVPQVQYNGCIKPLTGGTRQCPSTALRNDWPSEQVVVARKPSTDTEDLLLRDGTLAAYIAATDANGTPQPWGSLGGGIKGSPTGVWNSAGTVLDVFAIGLNDHVYRRRWSGAWGGWTAVAVSGSLGISGKADTESVNSEERPDGTIDLFIRGTSADAQHAVLDANANLLYWESLGGAIKGAPSGRWDSTTTRLDVFAIGAGNHPYHIDWITRIGWQSWSGALTGTVATAGTEAIMVVRAPDDSLDLFIRATDNTAWHATADSSGYITSWASMGGGIKGAPDGKWNSAMTRLDVFAIASNDLPYQDTWTGTWSGWHPVSPGHKWG
jgi:murein DD-endopeptidase MepM/ murein hydrolase activator NlpD